MLLQSHTGELSLLPALPEAWHQGYVTGLRARGGFTVHIAWREGRLSNATIHATREGTCRVRTATRVAVTSEGYEIPVERLETGLVSFKVESGQSYRVAPSIRD